MKKKSLIFSQSFLWMLFSFFTFGLTSCKIKDLQYISIVKVDNVKMGFQKTTADVYFKIYNPNSFTVKVDSVNADLKQEENAIGQIVTLGKISIAAKDSSVIPLKVSLKTGVAALSLIQYLGKSDTSPSKSTFLNGFGWVQIAGMQKRIALNQQVFPTPQ